jgi:hypothetical protein
MRPLTEKEFKAEAEPVLRQVFTIDNPFAPHPFAKTIPQRNQRCYERQTCREELKVQLICASY